MKPTLPGILCFFSALALFPYAARAENCTYRYQSGFDQLRSGKSNPSRGADQSRARMDVNSMFGPRPDLCEKGAYDVFADNFETFAREAMRAPKAARDNQLRLAIALVEQSPTRVAFEDGKPASTRFKQLKSNLNATADDVGFTPLMTQLIDTLTRIGPPMAGPAPADTAPPSSSPGPTNGQVQTIRVPTQPLPTWAVIKLYEMRDHAKAQDIGAIQIKLQDVLNWIESSTQNQP